MHAKWNRVLAVAVVVAAASSGTCIPVPEPPSWYVFPTSSNLSSQKVLEEAERIHASFANAKVEEDDREWFVESPNGWRFRVRKATGTRLFVKPALLNDVAGAFKHPQALRDEQFYVGVADAFVKEQAWAAAGEYTFYKKRTLRFKLGQTFAGVVRDEPYEVIVVFTRSLAGHDVIGAGGKMVFHLTLDGQIASAERIWREVPAPGQALPVTEPLLTEAEAYQVLKQRMAAEGEDLSTYDTSADFGYYEARRGVPMPYIAPAYGFELLSHSRRLSGRPWAPTGNSARRNPSAISA